jgi:hypothetical protein
LPMSIGAPLRLAPTAGECLVGRSACFHRACCLLDRSCGGPASPTTADQANAQNRSGPGRWKPAPVRRVLIVARMRSAEEYYRKVRRYSAGVMPMARRNARVKHDCEENWQLKAISLRAGAGRGIEKPSRYSCWPRCAIQARYISSCWTPHVSCTYFFSIAPHS